MKVENSIEEDIKILEEFKTNGYSILLMKYGDRIKTNLKLAKAIEHILKELKRFENMYEAEKRIHIVRNEQLARKQQLVIKCNELENENKELKKEIAELKLKWDKDTHRLQNDLDVANADKIDLIQQNEELKHKIEGQECVIEKQAHNEEVYEKLVMKLEKENEELKEKENKIYKEVQDSLAFAKFLIVKEREPDLFNQGRFYISQIIYDILNDVQNPEGIHKENKCIQYIDYIPTQKVKDIIDRIDYDIKKTKEIISNGRRNDYQIIRLRAMNTKSLDIKKRLQKLLESEE